MNGFEKMCRVAFVLCAALGWACSRGGDGQSVDSIHRPQDSPALAEYDAAADLEQPRTSEADATPDATPGDQPPATLPAPLHPPSAAAQTGQALPGLVGATASEQVQDHPEPRAQLGPKVFKGRVIAPVMSHEGADWLERPDREETEQPDKVIDALKIPLGSTVADIGAGTGYFSLRIAQRIGPEGRVLATEIQPEMLRLLGENMRKAGIVNIDRILCTERDAKLPPGKVDLALMVDVYHELYEPEATVAQIRRALKSDGRLVLVEYRGEDPTVPIKPEHKMTLRQVRYEIEPMGFRLKEVFEFLIHQHVIVMVKDEAYGEVVVIDPDDFPHVRIPGGMLPTEDDFQAASFKPLLNGKDLAGWDGDRLTWTMRDGLIVGRKLDGQPGGSYLCTQENYQDFELDVQWRLRDPQGNSGVQFRSQRRPDNQFAGYMMDIAPGRHASVAEEGGRGRLEQSTDTANAVILPGEWNRYTIRCLGDQITVAVNGVETVRFNDPNGPRSGVVALEQDQGEVEFKEIWIKRLVNDGSDE